MAKYDVKDQYGGKIGEIRSTPDYEQQALDAVGVGLGWVLVLVFQAVFASKLTVGIALVVLGVAVGGGWGAIWMIVGVGLGGWWAYQRVSVEPTRIEESVARRPPTEPKLTLAPGEKELFRFWTKASNKGVVTNQRIVWLSNDGSLHNMPIAAIMSVVPEKRSRMDYVLHLHNRQNGDDTTAFLTEMEMQRMADAVKSAMLGTA